MGVIPPIPQKALPGHALVTLGVYDWHIAFLALPEANLPFYLLHYNAGGI
jgi:hypothetical protein